MSSSGDNDVLLLNTIVRLVGGNDCDKILPEEWAETTGSMSERIKSLKGKDKRVLERVTLEIERSNKPPPVASPASNPSTSNQLTLERLDGVFRNIVALDTFVARVRDGVEDSQRSVDNGVSLLDYSNRCEQQVSQLQKKLELYMKSINTSDDISDWAGPLPGGISVVLLKWLVQLTRTSSVLCKVSTLLFSRDTVATDTEQQLVDPRGLVVSTVKTPTALGNHCNFRTRSWFGQQYWKRMYAVIWQQLLYLFPNDDPNSQCSQCLLLRSAKITSITTHQGKHNVVCLRDFLAPVHAEQILIQFDTDSKEWIRYLTQYVISIYVNL